MFKYFTSKIIAFLTIASIAFSNANAEEICRFTKIETRGWYGTSGLADMDLRPQTASSAVAITTGMEIHANLFMQIDETTMPVVAKSENFDPETSQFTVKINPDCRWSDGEPIRAIDFLEGIKYLYTSELQILPSLDFVENGQKVKSGQLPLEALGIKAVDDETLIFTLNVPPEMAKFVLSTIPYGPTPTHAIRADPNYWERPETEWVFSGAYYVKDIIGDQGIRLARNPYYCSNQELIVDEIEILYGKSYEENADQYLREGVDVMGDLSARLRGVFTEEGAPESYTLASSNVSSIMWLTLNYKQEVFKDPRVREAIRLAYDPEAINSGRIGILAKSADTLSVRSPEFDPPIFPWSKLPYQESIKQAQKLMEEAGYGPDNRLPLIFIGPPISEHLSVGSFYQSILNQIYIDVLIPPADAAKHKEMLTSEEPAYHLNVYYWFADFPDPFSFMEAIVQNHFHSDEVEGELKTMLSKANGTDNVQRLEWLYKMEELLTKDGYVLPGGIPERVWLSREGIEYKNTPYPAARDLAKFDCKDKN